MNLYHISQDKNNGWDTYSDAVVAAPSAKAARNMHPGGSISACGGTWVRNIDDVEVEFLGKAKKGTLAGVICASFHAG